MVKRYRLLFLVITLGLFTQGTAHAGHDLSAVVRMLQESYENTNDVTADFIQKTWAAGARKPVVAQGIVYFKRPCLMRWEYEKPSPQLIVTSGKEVYVYEKDANQVMILSRRQFLSSEISRAFFLGKGDLERYFHVKMDGPPGKDQEWSLLLVPRKPVPQVKSMRLLLDPVSHLVKEVSIEDQLGGRTHLVFSRIRLNQGLPDSLFEFEPPENIEIYKGD